MGSTGIIADDYKTSGLAILEMNFSNIIKMNTSFISVLVAYQQEGASFNGHPTSNVIVSLPKM